jgi:hypothetical protein
LDDFNSLERQVIEKLLTGDHPVLSVLRQQFATARFRSRDLTNVGFFTYIAVSPDEQPARLTSRAHLGDVSAAIPDLQNGAGFVLFITNGALDFLEGYTYDEPWPESIDSFTLRYWKTPRDLTALEMPTEAT